MRNSPPLWKNRVIDSFRRILTVSFLLLCVLCVFGDAGEGNVSVMGRLSELQALVEGFRIRAQYLGEFSRNRLEYFRRGLGWSQGDQHGFYSGDYQVYFSNAYCGLIEYDPAGEESGFFSVNYESDPRWAAFQDNRGRRLSVGYSGGEPVQIEWILGDGSRINAWDSAVQVTYPDGKRYYSLSYLRGEPILFLSRELAETVFYQTGADRSPESVLDDFTADFPYPYLSRILKDAVSKGVDLRDEETLARFAAHWFRRMLGLPDVSYDPLLDRAAENHAEYAAVNGVAARMLSWDINRVAPDSFLGLHDEIPGGKGFTGKAVTDRTAYTGYGSQSGEVATIGRFEVVSEVINWFHTVFHRRPFMDIRCIHYAHGHAADPADPGATVGVANWGYDFSRQTDGYVIYPVDGEELVPFAWTEVESPDPFPNDTTGTGPPITIAYTDRKYGEGEIVLLDPYGGRVACMVSPVAADPLFLEATPAEPLEPGTKYTIRYVLGSTVEETTFTTAPLNPAELSVRRMKADLAFAVDFRDRNFDLAEALTLNQAKGELEFTRNPDSLAVTDRKYGFVFAVPSAWEPAERDWQEIHLQKGYASLHLAIYPRGRRREAGAVRTENEPFIERKPLEVISAVSSHAAGVRVEYSWDYDGRCLVYYLLFGDFALIIYGYGVAEEEIAFALESFGPVP